MQWHWCRLVVAARPNGRRPGSASACHDARQIRRLPCGGGERVEAIHPEPTGYADFAARSEAAKSRGWPCRCAGRNSRTRDAQRHGGRPRSQGAHRTRLAADRGRGAVGISGRRVRHRRRRHPGAGVLRMLPAGRRTAGGADAALHRHLARDHHPDLDLARFAPITPGARSTWRSSGAGGCRS